MIKILLNIIQNHMYFITNQSLDLKVNCFDYMLVLLGLKTL